MEEIVVENLETRSKEYVLDEIMKQYGQEILQLTYSYVKNRTVAEDLTQEIFVKCYRSLHTYNQRAKLRTWLWRIAINHCKDYLRSWYNKHVVVTEHESETIGTSKETVEQAVIKMDEDEKLAYEVMNLPDNYREIIYLFYFEEMRLKDIAEVTGVNENTLKSRLKRAKELLKVRLEE
ncbi:sigma-70 family RNA polymerase sigma factor [Heyndrickxia vini]|uniref:Sigma-70 family RNA polymerase sigma factor n=1 Tax=Heyndrickxia vini TaxID=1476025 RepID=A0ABX7E3R2_9BACI|nr:sigma-70 family RNA polymerase sigma factor [Heyndrickxia vini]QQZ09881.1 sigma-70 family RNA polymerase sigma factor [Heyndrickxia vini]